MRRELVATQRLTQKQAEEFFSNIDAESFKNSSLWARQMVSPRVDQAHVFRSLVGSVYRCNYELAVGTLKLTPMLAKESETIPVFFWTLKEHDEDFRDDTIDYDYKYPVVDANRPYDLVQQAYLIRQAYQNGFSDRSKEVRTQMAGLLGVSTEHLGLSLGLKDEEF